MDIISSRDLTFEVKAATTKGLRAHAVILLAVLEKPFQQATEYVCSCGTVVAIGCPAGAFLKAQVLTTVICMISVKGSYVGNCQGGVEATGFFNCGFGQGSLQEGPSERPPSYLLRTKPRQVSRDKIGRIIGEQATKV